MLRLEQPRAPELAQGVLLTEQIVQSSTSKPEGNIYLGEGPELLVQDLHDPVDVTPVAPSLSDVPAQMSAVETQLADRVTALWKVHSKHTDAHERTRKELAETVCSWPRTCSA